MSGSYTAQVRNWLREQMDGQSQVKLPELTEAAVAQFSEDAAFVRLFLDAHLSPIIYDMAKRVMAETRGRENVFLVGDDLITRDGLTERGKKLQNKWARWLEHVNDRHMRLVEMEAEHLLTAASERRKRATTELEIATLFETLASRLKPGQKVGDLFSPDEIEQVRLSLIERDNEREAAD